MACISYGSSRNQSESSMNTSSRQARSRGVDNDENEGEDKDYSYQMYAQKLNNNAAMCIEIGYYEKATQSLQKALEFYQKLSDESLSEVVGPCNIDFSADFAPAPRRQSISYITNSDDDDDDDSYVKPPKRSLSKKDIHRLTKSISNPKVEKMINEEKNRQKGDTDKNAKWSIEDEYCDEESERHDHEDDGVYKRPIRVDHVGYPMGGCLFLIITFNLALALHLQVASTCSKKRYDSKSAKKALLFYELTSAHESRLLSDSVNRWNSLSSIRFNKILDGNLNTLLQYLPEMSIPAAQSLVSKVCCSVDNETTRLSRRPSSQNSRSSDNETERFSREPSTQNSRSSEKKMSRGSNSRRRPNDGKRSSSRDLSDSSSRDRISRSSRKPSGKPRKNKSVGGSSSSSRLQNALGDMAPATRS